jgi:hypothetical protein
MTSPPPASGRRFPGCAAPALLLLALLLPSCHGSNVNENRIKPIQADLVIDPFPGTPDPAVFVQKVGTIGDLVTVDVRLHATTPQSFDAFTLEFVYDFQKVQIGHAFDVNAALLGDCQGGLSCSPLCLNNAQQANAGATVDEQGRAHFLLGVAGQSKRCSITRTRCCSTDTDCPGGETCAPSRADTGRCNVTTVAQCAADPDCPPGETCNAVADTTLVTIGFIASTTIDPPGTPVTLYTNPDSSKRGDCEILSNLVDLGIPCEHGNATMTTTR